VHTAAAESETRRAGPDVTCEGARADLVSSWDCLRRGCLSVRLDAAVCLVLWVAGCNDCRTVIDSRARSGRAFSLSSDMAISAVGARRECVWEANGGGGEAASAKE
jgi:hypothetical protein